MSEIQTLSIPAEVPRNGFLQRLMDPTVDRSIATVAVLPMVWAACYRYHHFGLNLPVTYYFINTFVLVLTMALRRPANRITANPWFWLLAFVNTYFLVAILPFMDRGRIKIRGMLDQRLFPPHFFTRFPKFLSR